MRARILEILRRYLVAAAWVYFTLLALWALAYFLTGDRYPLLALLNILAPYLFLPLTLVFVLAVAVRRRELWIGLAIAVGGFGLHWGGLFLPPPTVAQNGQPTLKVMSYNVYVLNAQPAQAVRVIRDQDAELVLLQELTPELASMLDADLADRYPHRLLVSRNGPTGMGILSEFPLHPRAETLPLNWVGDPQILQLDWSGHAISLINFHMWPIAGSSARYLALNFRAREAQSLFLADLAGRLSAEEPLIVAGDANATELSDAYAFLSDVLVDSWREAGVGFGHTYPGSSARPIPGLNWHLPNWLARIDYVFHSGHWQAVSAEVVPSSGGSDHRPVIVELVLRESAAGTALMQEPDS